MSNSLDPDQAPRFVGADLGPNCSPRLSADDTGRQRVNTVNILRAKKADNKVYVCKISETLQFKLFYVEN